MKYQIGRGWGIPWTFILQQNMSQLHVLCPSRQMDKDENLKNVDKSTKFVDNSTGMCITP
jgi:hypothetical protein